MPSVKAKPLTPARRQHEEDERRDQGDHVRVDDRRDPLLVALGDRREHRSARPDLLLYSLEDDDVGVRRDADREDQAGDARQRQGDRDELDQGEEEGGVDEQPEPRDQAEEAVVEDQEEEDDDEAREAGLQPLVERLLAERRRDRRLADQRELDRQRADPQELGQVLGLGDREVARDLGPGAAVDPVGVLLEVDDRPRLQLAVEHDREAVGELGRGRLVGGRRGLAACREVGVLAAQRDVAGHLLERLAPAVGEVEGDVGLAGGRVRRLLGVLDLVARQRRAVLEHEELRVGRLALVDVGRRGVVDRRLLEHDRPLRDLDHLRVRAAARRRTAGRGP